MINRIVIGIENRDVFEFFKNYLGSQVFEIILKNENDFFVKSNLDIFHYYGAFAEKFKKKPKYLESIVISTEGKFGMPPYLVTSPTFKNSKEFSHEEMLYKQLQIPLQKAIDFSSDKSSIIRYGIHMNLVLQKSEDIFENGNFLCDSLLKLLEKNSIAI